MSSAKEIVVSEIVKKLETERKRRMLANNSNADGTFSASSEDEVYVSAPSLAAATNVQPLKPLTITTAPAPVNANQGFDYSAYIATPDEEDPDVAESGSRSRLSSAISEAVAARRRLRKASNASSPRPISENFAPDAFAPPVPMPVSSASTVPKAAVQQKPIQPQPRQQLHNPAQSLDKHVAAKSSSNSGGGAKQRLDDILNSLCADLDEAMIQSPELEDKVVLGPKKVATRKKSSAEQSSFQPIPRHSSAPRDVKTSASSLSDMDRLRGSGSSGRLQPGGSGSSLARSPQRKYDAPPSEDSLGSDELPATVFKSDSASDDILAKYAPSSEELRYEDAGGRLERKETVADETPMRLRPISRVGEAPNGDSSVAKSHARAARVKSVLASGMDADVANPVPREEQAKGVNEHGYMTREPILEKVGKVGGVPHNFFISRAELYCMTSKDSTILPHFPVPLQCILHVSWDKKVVITYLFKNDKKEPRIGDMEVDFYDLFTSSQWALRLQSIACKGNPAEVVGKQAIFFVDPEDVKGIKEILSGLIIPILETARKPFDIQLVEPDGEKFRQAIDRLDLSRVNSVIYLRLKNTSTKVFKVIDECLNACAMKATGRDPSRIRILQPELDPIEVALAVVKEPLHHAQFCVMNTIIKHEKGRAVKSKQKHGR